MNQQMFNPLSEQLQNYMKILGYNIQDFQLEKLDAQFEETKEDYDDERGILAENKYNYDDEFERGFLAENNGNNEDERGVVAENNDDDDDDERGILADNIEVTAENIEFVEFHTNCQRDVAIDLLKKCGNDVLDAIHLFLYK